MEARMVGDKGEVDIRQMTEADLPQIREIDQLIVGKERTPSWTESAEVLWFFRSPALSFVAELDSQVVGFLLGDIRGAEYGTPISGWIDLVGIHPDYQRQGIGRRLVERFYDECQRDGIRIRAIIRGDDKRITRFFTSIGFRKGKLVDFER
jgi:ribosomal protein S18 acetylase RimI-like enzyme